MKSFFWTETQHITIETGATALTVKTFNDNLASTVEKDSIKHKYVEMMRRKDGGRGVHNALICGKLHSHGNHSSYIYIHTLNAVYQNAKYYETENMFWSWMNLFSLLTSFCKWCYRTDKPSLCVAYHILRLILIH